MPLIRVIVDSEKMVYQVSLNKGWKLKGFKESVEAKKIHLPNYDDSEWMDVEIPSEVHLELLKRGQIDDPYYYNNLDKLSWIPSWEWWYRLRFTLPSNVGFTKAFIIFHGLDTLANAWLNGNLIGTFKNMFREYKIDVTDLILKDEENVLAIKFDPIVKKHELHIKDWHEWHEKEWLGFRPKFRKAQMSFGWDIAPKFLTIGIWKDVELLLVKRGLIEDVYVRTKNIEKKNIKVDIFIKVTTYMDGISQITATILDKGELVAYNKTEVKGKGTHNVTLSLEIKNGSLWWPWDLGDPHLYELKIALYCNNELEDSRELRFGIRDIRLVTRNHQGRDVFKFLINGMPVYIRGINWTPPDAIFTRIDKARYAKLLEMVKDMNANMLRVWGGGIYPHDAFYDLCDEMGIMIWQDFMFACANYPRTDEFLNEVREEATDIVRRLRNHPSIILWCGDNECDAMFHPEGHPLNRKVLKQVCREYDPTRPYWPSSPCGGDRPNSPDKGDTHIWHHGTYYKAEIYQRELAVALFVSEIGHLSCPNIDTLRSYIPHEKIWPPNEDYRFGYHPWSLKRLRWLEKAMKTYWGILPSNLEEYIRVSQLLQAEAYKYWIEKCRKRKFDNGGIVLWNVTDCWPQCSDSIIDYYGRPKLAYYYVKIAFSPVLVSAEVYKDHLIPWVVNDTLKPISGILKLTHYAYPCNKLTSYEYDVHIPANSLKILQKVPLSNLHITDERNEYILLELLNKNEVVLSKNVVFLAETRELRFPPEEIIEKCVQ